MEREQMVKLLASGKTDLLHRFISKKGRPFSAYLAKGSDGKIGFEFAPRKGKAAATEQGAAATVIANATTRGKTAPKTIPKRVTKKTAVSKAPSTDKAVAPAKKKKQAATRKKAAKEMKAVRLMAPASKKS